MKFWKDALIVLAVFVAFYACAAFVFALNP